MSQSRILLSRIQDDFEDPVMALADVEGSVVLADTTADAMDWLDRMNFDCVISAARDPGNNALQFLERVTSDYPDVHSILYAEQMSDSICSQARDIGTTRCVESTDDPSQSALREAVQTLLTASIDTGPPSTKRTVSDPGKYTPSAERLVRAIEQAPIGITVTDPSLPDNPVVYLNDAYKELTGYDADDILGRNARMLQGPETDPEAAAKLRRAVDTEEATSVELQNYRSDGTAFWNRVTIAPVYDENEQLRHFVGFQEDVTARRAAEERARRRASALYEDRQTFDQAHTRLQTLVAAIVDALTTADDRETLLADVRAAIDTTDLYTGGWIARTTHDRGDPVGIVTDGDDPMPQGTELQLNTGGPIAEAFQTGSVVMTQSPTDSELIDPAAYDATTLIAIPLTYRSRVYGVLGVYADHPGVELIDREAAVLEALGSAVGVGLAMLRTRRALRSDAVIALEFGIHDESLILAQVARALDSDITYQRYDTDFNDHQRLHVSVDDPPSDLRSQLQDLDEIASISTIIDRENDAIASFVVDAAPLIETVTAAGLVLQEATATPTGVTIEVTAPADTDVRQIIELFEQQFTEVEFRSQRDTHTAERAPGEFVAAVRQTLTDRQSAALETAYESGYFEWPRPVEGDELAESMGITRQTFHQHLRTAERKLLAAFFDP